MSVLGQMVQTWRSPRAGLRARLNEGPREDKALALAMGTAALIFVAQAPVVARTAHLAQQQALAAGTPASEVPTLQSLLGITFFALVFMLPLVLYAAAAASHLIAKALGGKGSHSSARVALFWALFCAVPAMLLHGLARGLLGDTTAVAVLGVVVLMLFSYLWMSMLIEAERAH
jgi:hypothetical protein